MNHHKLKEAAVPAIIAVLLAVGGMALLFGWMGCYYPTSTNDPAPITTGQYESLESAAGRDTAARAATAPPQSVAPLPNPNITPMTVSEATGGAVTEAEVQAEAERVQQDHPDWPWEAVLLSVASTLTYRKAAPHIPIIGAAASAMARANPLLALVGSIIHSTTEINRANANKAK